MSNISDRWPIHGHIILTQGAKPAGRIERHGPARHQVRNLTAFALEHNYSLKRLTCDHARRVRGTSSFPELARALKQTRESGRGAVVVDDLSRLFRSGTLEERYALLGDLVPFVPFLFGIRQKRRLEEIRHKEMMAILLNPDRGRWSYGRRKSSLSAEDRRDQTSKAVAASLAARSSAADIRAKDLASVRDELIAAGTTPTSTAIAKEANRRGLRNGW